MQWPNGAALAVFVNVAYEQWSPSKAPGISPMGNPLPGGITDTQARSWGAYGDTGIHRLLQVLDRTGTTSTVMVSGSFTETSPDTVRDIADRGHEICGHGYYQDVLPPLLSDDEEAEMVSRCTNALEKLTGQQPHGWISPRGTPSERTAGLLAAHGYTWFGDCFDTDAPTVRSTSAGDLVFLPLTMEVNDLPMVMKHGRPIGDYRTEALDILNGFLRHADGTYHLDITVHAHVGGRPALAAQFEDTLRQLHETDGVWVTTRAQATEHVLAHAATSAAEG